MEQHDILDLAEWFLQQQPMSHKKVQKMCYYAVAWSYALFGESLFADSDFEAWAHGPVSVTLFNKYKGNGWDYLMPEGRQIDLDSREIDLLESIMLTYGDNTANGLEALSHTEMPWIRARVGVPDGAPSHNLINKNDMIEYYRSIYSGDEA